MSKLDDKYYSLLSVVGTDNYYPLKDDAEKAIKDLMLELIGEDENEAEYDRRYDDPENHDPIQNQEAYMNNQFRAELRQKVSAL